MCFPAQGPLPWVCSTCAPHSATFQLCSFLLPSSHLAFIWCYRLCHLLLLVEGVHPTLGRLHILAPLLLIFQLFQYQIVSNTPIAQSPRRLILSSLLHHHEPGYHALDLGHFGKPHFLSSHSLKCPTTSMFPRDDPLTFTSTTFQFK